MRSSNPIDIDVRLYAWCVILLGAGLFAIAAYSDRMLVLQFAQNWSGVVIFFLLGIVLQLTQHKLAVGPATGSIAFIVYMSAVLVFGPAVGAAITGASVGTAWVVQKKPALKIAFNVSQHITAALAGLGVYKVLGGQVPLRSLDGALVPFLGLVVTFFGVNSAAVSVVVALTQRRKFAEVWVRNTWGWLGYDLVASTLALGTAWLYVTSGIPGVAVVLVPILFLRHVYLINTQLQATNRELLELMVKAVEARDPYTSGHSQRVAEIARTLAQEMGLHLREIDKIETAALLHDVGKIYEEFAPILRKETKLTSDERRIMESHPVRSAELVGTISSLRGYIERCIRHHHENFDGSGYPSRLSGHQIPLGARIILVADAADAMTTDRPYRRALSYERVLDELERYSGRQFDPAVVSAFKRSAAIRRRLQGTPPALERHLEAGSSRPVQLVGR